MSAGAYEFTLLTIAGLCAISTVMTVAVMAQPWDMLEWRLVCISALSLVISLLVLWIGATTT